LQISHGILLEKAIGRGQTASDNKQEWERTKSRPVQKSSGPNPVVERTAHLYKCLLTCPLAALGTVHTLVLMLPASLTQAV
jgi:hypothetical protein